MGTWDPNIKDKKSVPSRLNLSLQNKEKIHENSNTGKDKESSFNKEHLNTYHIKKYEANNINNQITDNQNLCITSDNKNIVENKYIRSDTNLYNEEKPIVNMNLSCDQNKLVLQEHNQIQL